MAITIALKHQSFSFVVSKQWEPGQADKENEKRVGTRKGSRDQTGKNEAEKGKKTDKNTHIEDEPVRVK